MERSRLGFIGCALLALTLLGACSDDEPGTGSDPDPVMDGGGGGGNNNDEPPNNGNSNNNSSNNNGPEPDAGAGNNGNNGNTGNNTGNNGEPNNGGENTGTTGECVPMGCDDLGAECGLIDPGCGLPLLDCDPEGDACALPEYCAGDPAEPNKCGCKPKTCEDVVPGGAECGENIPDQCGGVIASCGDCSDQSGGNWMCGSTSNQCECAAGTCGTRVCGTVPDGCGGPVLTCGPNNGACDSPAKKCDAAGGCVCKTDAEHATIACAGKTCGTVTAGGCTFNCGPACTTTCTAGQDCTQGCNCPVGPPAQQCGVSKQCCAASTPAALCAGKACGTSVVDPCTGETVACGCAAGQACVDKSYIEGATANQCLETNLANLLGGYVVRTHAFTNAGGIVGLNRAESISKVSIRRRTNNTLEMVDEGCVATSINASGSTTTVAPAYFNIPPVRATVTQSGATWERPFQAVPVTLGFVPQLPGSPAFCNGTAAAPTGVGADYDTIPSDLDAAPTLGSGTTKAWLAGAACTCPVTAKVCTPADLAAAGTGPAVDKAEACLPADTTGAATTATDCRINDIDKDGKPGFTAIGASGAFNITTGAVTAANIKWNGAIGAQPHHAGTALDPQPTYRNVVYCEGVLGCNGIEDTANTSCNTKFNRVQFHKLTPTEFTALQCSKFYTPNIDAGQKITKIGDVKTAEINQYFGGQYACGAGNTCPDGLLCQAGQCVPKTSPGACANGVSCGDGWVCSSTRGNSCWPSGTCQ